MQGGKAMALLCKMRQNSLEPWLSPSMQSSVQVKGKLGGKAKEPLSKLLR